MGNGDTRHEVHALSRAIQNDFFLDISRGKMAGFTNIFKYGRNPDVGILEEVIWDNGGDYTFLEQAEFMSVVSTSDEDRYTTGLGAHLLKIIGLDSEWNEISEIIQLNGTIPVITTKQFLRVFRSYVVCGSEQSISPTITPANRGDITITSQTSLVLQAKILTGNGQTLMAVYTVPADRTAYITNAMISIGQGKQAVFKLKVKENQPLEEGVPINCVFRTQVVLEIYENAVPIPINTRQRILPKTDIVITGQLSSTPNVQISTFFELILVREGDTV